MGPGWLQGVLSVTGLDGEQIYSRIIPVSPSKRQGSILGYRALSKQVRHFSTIGRKILSLSQRLSLSLFLVSRFGHRLNVSDLYKLTDTVAIREQGNGRLVCLLPSSQARQSPLGSSQSHDGSSTNCSPIIFRRVRISRACLQAALVPTRRLPRYVTHFLWETIILEKVVWSLC